MTCFSRQFAASAITLFCLYPQAQADINFQNYYTITTGSWPEAVVIADLNNDGRQDVALTTSYYFDEANDYTLKLFYQDEAGELAPQITLPLNAGYTYRPDSLATGDFNGDGLADLCVGVEGTSIEIFLQSETGEMVLDSSISTPYSYHLKAADLNADGLDDIVGSYRTETALFYQNNGTITPSPYVLATGNDNYSDMALGDINNDGNNDIVLMSGSGYAYDNLTVIRGNSDGSFQPETHHDLGGNELTKGVTIGDLDNDGRNDIAVSFGGNQPTAKIGIFYQDNKGGLESATVLNSYDVPETILVADMDLDNKDDLLVLHGGWYRLGVYAQTNGGRLLDEQLFSQPYASHYNRQGMAVGDINGDGLPDVAVANYNYGLVVMNGQNPALGEPPVAIAGDDQMVAMNSTVYLDGSDSYDSDGTLLDYNWTQTAGESVSFTPVAPGVESFTAPAVPAGSTLELEFRLTVTDDTGQKHSDSVLIAVSNLPPVAEAGADRSGHSGGYYYLFSSDSYDSDGTITDYQWEQLSGTPVTLNEDPEPGVAGFSAPELSPDTSTSLVFRLTVTDDSGLSDSDNMVFHISNLTPVAEAGADQAVDQSLQVYLDGSASYDNDTAIISYHWQQLSGTAVSLDSPDNASTSFTSPPMGGDLVFQLTVTDENGLTDSDTITISVSDNQAPLAAAGSDQTLSQNSLAILDGSLSQDPDGDSISYLWQQIQGPLVSLSDSSSSQPTFTTPILAAGEAATLTFSLTVTDEHGLSSSDTVTVFLQANQAPAANAGTNQTVKQGSTVLLDASDSMDSDGSIVSYQWLQTSSSTVILSADNQSRVTFSAPRLKGKAKSKVLVFQLTVTDDLGLTSTDEISILVTKN
ncbi:PKD domain-containing protein [Pontibacter sp. JAM-7]|uniref:PKD domain-containing protein n=1 Tax=Pontibacter sp. JAM-7 TaxID=3366581 RepID=UPI003AF54879